MRLAWFRPTTDVSQRLDDSALLIRALGVGDEIEVFDEARAHDFIRLDFRKPFDLCVFELGDTPRHAFVWPYLLHVPGVLRLRSASLHDSRSDALRWQHRERDRNAELAFGDWDLVAAPIVRSRLTVVSDPHTAERLQRSHPTARIRHAPVGLGSDPGSDPGSTTQKHAEFFKSAGDRGQTRGQTPVPVVGAVDRGDVERAVARARKVGATFELMIGTAEQILDRADIVIAMTWPPNDELTLALAAMATRRAVVVFESETTAGWPALDPQTWQPRGWTGRNPIVVSVDPRDEEHSLSLALRRLAHEPALRQSLGASAHSWWRQHATPDHAVRAWRAILTEAVTLNPPPRPANWPPHLTADGTARAREILDPFGATVDFL